MSWNNSISPALFYCGCLRPCHATCTNFYWLLRQFPERGVKRPASQPFRNFLVPGALFPSTLAAAHAYVSFWVQNRENMYQRRNNGKCCW